MNETPEYRFILRNYVLGVVNGAGFYVGMTLISTSTAGAVFITHLIDKRWAVGLVSSLFIFGWLWPQIFISNMLEHRPWKKPFYVLSAVSRVALFGLALLMIRLIGDSHPRAMFWLFALLMFGFCTMSGVGIIPFMDIVSKSVPPHRRAAFFSLRQFFGGLLGFAAGFLVKAVLKPDSGWTFPDNFLLLFGIAYFFFTVSTFSFCFCSEPRGIAAGRPMKLRQRIRRGWRIFRRDRNYQRLYLVKAALSLAGMAAPIYPVFAVQDLGFSESRIGLFIKVGAVAGILSNILWRHIGDCYGNRLLFLWTTAFALAAPAAALIAACAPDAVVAGVRVRLAIYLLVYATAFPAMAGSAIAQTNYLLEIAPDARRPTYVGFMLTIGAPLAFTPLIGGVLADLVSGLWVFGLSALFLLAALALICGMEEPRRSPRLGSRYTQWRSTLRADGLRVGRDLRGE